MTDAPTTDAGPYAAPGGDVVDILTADHREFLDLVEEIRASGRPEVRRDLADVLTADLMRHAVAEEMYVYPAIREHVPGGEEAVQHDVAEHQQLEETLKQLESVDAGEQRFSELMGELEGVLRDHVQDEESEQFPMMRARIPHDQLHELGSKVQAAKALAPTRPHPAAPHAELFHKLVGPGVGFVDRLRDKLSGRGA